MQTARKRLRAWRGTRTLLEAAPDLGCNPSMLSLLETGKRRPGRDLAVRIRDATGIRVELWSEEAQAAAKGAA